MNPILEEVVRKASDAFAVHGFNRIRYDAVVIGQNYKKESITRLKVIPQS